MTHDVFVSYSTQDKLVADALCATLENRKIRCWIAPRDMPPGSDYPAALVQALNNSQILVLVFSKDANASDHVMREVEKAVRKGIPIIPFRIENVEPTGAMDYLLSTKHWLDALTPPLEKHLEKLADTIQTLLDSKEELHSQSVARKEENETVSRSRSYLSIQKTKFNAKPTRIIAALVLIVIILVSAFFFSDGFSGSNKAVTMPTSSASTTAAPLASDTTPTAMPTTNLNPLPVNSSNNESLDFTPEGVAIIELINGSKYSVPSNSLVFVNQNTRSQNYGLIQGIPTDKEILFFENMKSFRITNDSIIVTDQDGRNVTHEKGLTFDWVIGLASNGELKGAEIKQVTFDHSTDWQQPIPMATITTNLGDSFKVPAKLIITQIYDGTYMGSSFYDWKLGIVTNLGNFVPFKEIIRLEYIGWNITGNYGYRVKLTTTEGNIFEVDLKSTVDFWSLNKLGVFEVSVSALKSVDFDWSP
jgi:hypothetical protein